MFVNNILIRQSIKLYSHNASQFTSTQPYFSITYTQSKRQSQVHIRISYKHNLQLSSCLHPHTYIYIPRQSQYAFNIKSTSIHVYIFFQSFIAYIQHQVYIHTYIYRFNIFTQSEVTIQTAQFKTIGESSSRESLSL